MPSAADRGALGVLETPAFKSALEALMRSGSWVERRALDGLAHSPVAMDDALADLVMLGRAEYRAMVGYRLTQPRVVRAAARQLALDPTLQRHVELLQVDVGVHMGVAKRSGPGVLDVAMFGMVLPLSSEASLEDAMAHATAVQMAVGRSFDKQQQQQREARHAG